MNMFQRVNLTASFLVIAALVGAFAQALHESKGKFDPMANINVILLGVFIFLFKVKTMLDDHQHFGEPHMNKDGFRHAGFLLALLSWFFWGLAAWSVVQPTTSAQLMIFSVGISTMWVGVHVIEILMDTARRSTEAAIAVMREKWVILNVIYMLILAAFLGMLAPKFEALQPGWLIALLVVFAFDYITSKSWPKVAG